LKRLSRKLPSWVRRCGRAPAPAYSRNRHRIEAMPERGSRQGNKPLVAPLDPAFEIGAIETGEAPVGRAAAHARLQMVGRKIGNDAKRGRETRCPAAAAVDLSLMRRRAAALDCNRAAIEAEKTRQTSAKQNMAECHLLRRAPGLRRSSGKRLGDD